MLNLYKGLLDITIKNSKTQISEITTHIRQFNEKDENSLLQPKSYWNLLLEMSWILITLFKSVIGIGLLMCMFIVFYPLNAFLSYLELFVVKSEQSLSPYTFAEKPLLEETTTKKLRAQK